MWIFAAGSCSNFDWPQPKISLHNNDIEKEKVSKTLSIQFINQLTEDQKHIFGYIINIKNRNLFYTDGPGGSGKTFLYTAFIYYYTSLRKTVLLLAWTGIDSILLP